MDIRQSTHHRWRRRKGEVISGLRARHLDTIAYGLSRFGHVFSADAGNSVGEIVGMTKAINSVDFKPSRPFRAITGSEDNAVSYFEGPPFKWKTTMSTHDKFVHVVRYSPDGEKFASGAADGRVSSTIRWAVRIALDGLSRRALRFFSTMERQVHSSRN